MDAIHQMGATGVNLVGTLAVIGVASKTANKVNKMGGMKHKKYTSSKKHSKGIKGSALKTSGKKVSVVSEAGSMMSGKSRKSSKSIWS